MMIKLNKDYVIVIQNMGLPLTLKGSYIEVDTKLSKEELVKDIETFYKNCNSQEDETIPETEEEKQARIEEEKYQTWIDKRLREEYKRCVLDLL